MFLYLFDFAIDKKNDFMTVKKKVNTIYKIHIKLLF
jgi:hypothetical protein